LRPQALEVFSPGAARILSGDAAVRFVPEARGAGGTFSKAHWTLAADFSGNEKVLERCERDFSQMAGQCGGADCAALTPEQMAAVAGLKREFIPIALASSAAATVVKASVLPSRMGELLACAARAAETNSLPCAVMARGLGVAYAVLSPNDRSEEARRRVIQATDQLLHECAKLGGNASIPWSPAEWKPALKVWGVERAETAQMGKLKKLFDPLGILSPGRFMGGL
jgi:FAD/FMN-containing dehydrogenase